MQANNALLYSFGFFISAITGMKDEVPEEEMKIVADAVMPAIKLGWAMTE